jgi:hypothetical protein
MESFGCPGTGTGSSSVRRSCVWNGMHFISISSKWNLMLQVLKYISTPTEINKGVEIYSECQYCGNQVRGASCLFCKKLVLQCSICNLSVRGETVCSYSGSTQFKLHPDTGHLVRFSCCILHWLLNSRLHVPLNSSYTIILYVIQCYITSSVDGT